MVLCLFVASPLFAENKTLYFVADNGFQPFSFKKDGKVTGIDIEVIQEMAKRLNIKINVNLVPWRRVLAMTKAGKCDGSIALFKTAEREEYALYTAPVHYSTYVIFVKKGNVFPFSSIKDLYGKRIGKDAAFAISEELDQAVKNEKIIVEEVEGIDKNILKTYRERIDGFIGNLHVSHYTFKTDEKLKKYKDEFVNLEKPIKPKKPTYIVISKAAQIENKMQLVEKITKTLNDIHADGTYKKIVNNYLN